MGAASHPVITSRQIAADPNVPDFLLTLSGRGIIPPADREVWPARDCLADIAVAISRANLLED